MLERLSSLRLWLLVAMVGTTLIAIAASNFIVRRLDASSEVAADRAKAEQVAGVVAARVRAGADADELAAFQQLLPNDQLVVVRGGETLFAGPARSPRSLELTVTAPVPGGHVLLRDYRSPSAGPSSQMTLVAAVIGALVIAEAWLAATILVRAVRRPVGRAIEAADRLASGDFSARMGTSGPDEFARLGRAFDQMAERLQRADAEQKRFLGDLVHEVATPVSAVTGFALALADGDGLTEPERAGAAEMVVRESGRLRRLLDDVRRLSRLDLTESVRREPVDLAEVCAGAAGRFGLAAAEAGVTLSAEGDPVLVQADPRLVDVVLDNFVSNALRYTRSGGEVQIRAGRRRSTAEISVRDTGIGIAPEHLERIYDRLYRTDEARDRATGGSGLGLAIARRAAVSLGGRIEVASRPGEGSEFRLVLPVRRETPQVDAPKR